MPDDKEEGQNGLVRAAASQVMALDLDGDMRTDLLGGLLELDPISGDCRAAGVAVWRNQGDGSFELMRDPLGAAGEAEAEAAVEAAGEAAAVAAVLPSRGSTSTEGATSTEGVRLASPHSSAQVDLDGDCVADLMLVTLPHGATAASCARQARELRYTIYYLLEYGAECGAIYLL